MTTPQDYIRDNAKPLAGRGADYDDLLEQAGIAREGYGCLDHGGAPVRYGHDAVFHLDETRAVEPFDKGELWRPEEVPDTYPFGV